MPVARLALVTALTVLAAGFFAPAAYGQAVQDGTTVATISQTNLPAKMTVPSGTPIRLILQEELDSQRNREGDEVSFALAEDIYVSGRLALAKGTPATGRVADAKPAKSWGRGWAVAVEISSLRLPDGNELQPRL